jgi:uracil phosphoribosyltransferase
VTHRPVEYYAKLPAQADAAPYCRPDAGDGNRAAVELLNRHGFADRDIRLMVLVAAPEGVRNLEESHPDVPVYTAALDERLNEKAYILPGLGDAGDRLFGTNERPGR